jgi:hypothetical protein
MSQMPKKNKKLDLENVKPEYWEKILQSYGLGVKQIAKDDSDERSGEAQSGNYGVALGRVSQRRNPGAQGLAVLRNVVELNDQFLRSHQIRKIRVEERPIPEWAIDDRTIQVILLTAFPKMLTDERQRRRAGAWLRVFYLYYRLGMTYSQVAKETGLNEGQVQAHLRSLSRVAQGKTRHGKARKKVKGPYPVPALEGTRRKENEAVQGPHVPSSGDGSVGEEGAVS